MIIPTLLILASVPAVSSNSPADMPEVGVPFACGRIYPVSQAHDTGSHKYNDTYAWDFRMPEGTPVVAAHDGVVRLARGDSTEGGCDEKFAPMANYVVISHGDGFETQYLHFSAVVVKPGEHVKQGQLLGFSGEHGLGVRRASALQGGAGVGARVEQPLRPRAHRWLWRSGARHDRGRAAVPRLAEQHDGRAGALAHG